MMVVGKKTKLLQGDDIPILIPSDDTLNIVNQIKQGELVIYQVPSDGFLGIEEHFRIAARLNLPPQKGSVQFPELMHKLTLLESQLIKFLKLEQESYRSICIECGGVLTDFTNVIIYKTEESARKALITLKKALLTQNKEED